ncbi:MAG TPA: hypothetical protein VF713_01960 [Thermoanaerobaculia bacterium]
MLTQIYRFGPSRQQILKGFVVFAPEPKRVLLQALATLPGAQADIRINARESHCVWVDTGMTWLHTAHARRACLSQLARRVQELARHVQEAGGQLLPSAIRPTPNERWKQLVCGDQHILETIDDNEKEVYCNLIREYLPLLIALTGRTGAGPEGIEPHASRRLSDSGQHLAARYFASVSPRHLDRVLQCLRRDEGVGRLELLDIRPIPGNDDGSGSVELRFTDAQILNSSTLAHAMLYQALLIRARRLTRNGRRVGNIPQSLIAHNRSRAIADGLQARFEDDDRGRAAKEKSKSRGRFVAAREKLLELLEDLLPEFQALEAEFAEIAPLVVGAGLRLMGHAGLQNENDMLRYLHRQGKVQGAELAALMGRMATGGVLPNEDPITAINRQLFESPYQRLRRWWTLILANPTPKRARAPERTHARKPAPPPSRPRRGGDSDAASPKSPGNRPGGAA